MRQPLFLFSVLILAAASSNASAQTVIRCGGGTTSTASVVINSAGELVFPETSIVCGTTASPLPPALSLEIDSPSHGEEISVAEGPQPVPFTASLTNFTSPYDQCPNVKLTAPGGSATNVALAIQNISAGLHEANAVLNIAADAPTGSYRADLNCTRVIDNQQIMLNLPFVEFNVVGGGNPDLCDPPPAIMQINIKNYADPHPNGFGKAFGLLIAGSTVFSAGNVGAVTDPLSPPQTLNVRSWRFTAPAEQKTGIINLPPGMNGLASFSSCPGVYDVPATCRKIGSNSYIKWSTKPSEAGACLLEPGQTYYLNGAHFSLTNFVGSGVYNNICGCANPPCGNCNLVFQPQAAQ